MSADIGFIFLMFSLGLSITGVVTSFLTFQTKLKKYLVLTKLLNSTMTLCAFCAAFVLWTAFFERDYSIAYIYKNSSNDLPWFYTISAFWCSLEGSHFLWTLLMCTVSTIALWTHSKENTPIIGFVAFVFQCLLVFMFFLLTTISDPFKIQFPISENGLGMNELLQNPYMMIHPPILFLGYSSLMVPFAYSLAALCFGDMTKNWLTTTRRWALIAWTLLTAGIFLGGRWAYVELGWAGYWAWDPVENSSFLPWLLTTSLLHSLLVQEKLGQMKRANLLLGIFAFFFSFFGTFITRSGIINSVHSFAQSPIGPNYLYFLATMLLVTCVLYYMRSHYILPQRVKRLWGFSRETFIAVMQFVLVSFVIIIFMGTMYPIISEAFTGIRFDIQAPYFNSFAPYIGFILMILITFGNLLRFQSKGLDPLKWKVLGGGVIFSLCVTPIFCVLGGVNTSQGFGFFMQIVGVFLCFFAFFGLSFECYSRLKNANYKISSLLLWNRAYLGGYLAHVGFLIAILGFLGNYRGSQKLASFKSGDQIEFFGYQIRFFPMITKFENNTFLFLAPLEVRKQNTLVTTLYPGRAKYPTKDEMFHEVDTYSIFWHDLYASLVEFDPKDPNHATVEIHLNPTVRLVWISLYFLILGGLLSLFDKKRGKNSKDYLALS